MVQLWKLWTKRPWDKSLQSLAGKLSRPGGQEQSPQAMDTDAHNRNTNMDTETDTDSATSSERDIPMENRFKFIPASFGQLKVNALIDTGSNVHIMSHSMYNSIPKILKSSLQREKHSVTVADNVTIECVGSASVQVTLPNGKHKLKVLVMKTTSQPFILGNAYFQSHGVCLDFEDNTVKYTKAKVRAKKATTIPANSEAIMLVKVQGRMPIGANGICVGSKALSSLGVLMARSMGCISPKHTIAIKVLNPTNGPVFIKQNFPIAHFQVMDDNCLVSPMYNHPTVEAQVNNVEAASQSKQDQSTQGEGQVQANDPDFVKFISYFDFVGDELTEEQRLQVQHMLYDNHDIFVTDENPDIGFTEILQHKIHLKPHVKMTHQRPYKLTPEKKTALRHVLENLYEKGIIAPVNDREDLPITSPVVLVTKPRASTSKNTKEAIVSQWRFTVDYRALNELTCDFNYIVPDLQDLVESFTETIPNYITVADLSMGFHQIGIHPDSRKYTAFDTCFGTYTFRRMPMGLKTAPNTLQMLMDKVLKGLVFESCLCYLDDLVCASSTFEHHI